MVIYKEYDETIIYPVNVVRNVARTSALTKYVLLSDIELMPSKGKFYVHFINNDNTWKISDKLLLISPNTVFIINLLLLCI